MHQDVTGLLAVQLDDAEIFRLEDLLAALAPRLRALAADTLKAEEALASARAAVETEHKRQTDLQFRITQHRELVKRNEAVFQLRHLAPRSCVAASAQVEQARRMLADDEARESRRSTPASPICDRWS